ncbi:hypothetical protein ACFLS5_04000 [Candidatus Bipolaricaulota bacterium]
MELTNQEVAILARVAGLEMSDEDLKEVAFRLEVMLRKMDTISHPDLDVITPLPFLPFEEIRSGR